MQLFTFVKEINIIIIINASHQCYSYCNVYGFLSDGDRLHFPKLKKKKNSLWSMNEAHFFPKSLQGTL